MKTATMTIDVPTTPHFAIVEFSSYHVDGDERSRTNPGHGYPAHDVSTASYRWTLDRSEWENEVRGLAADRYTHRQFVALEVRPAKITTAVKVST